MARRRQADPDRLTELLAGKVNRHRVRMAAHRGRDQVLLVEGHESAEWVRVADAVARLDAMERESQR